MSRYNFAACCVSRYVCRAYFSDDVIPPTAHLSIRSVGLHLVQIASVLLLEMNGALGRIIIRNEFRLAVVASILAIAQLSI